MYILNFIRGFCMALADSVPGVSGGTIAFILGFYDDFVNSLNNLILGTKIDRINSLKFLSKIGIGWIVGFVLSILFIASIFEENIYKLSSLFLGFIIASIPPIIKAEKKILSDNKKNILFLILGIVIVSSITYFNPITKGGYRFSIKLDSLNLPFILYIFISGVIAISAMVLPGISGSTILLIFGLYAPILNALKEVFKLNFEYLPAIGIFIIGIIVGILITLRIVRYLLRTYRAQTIYCIIGLMIGSIYAVIMGPTALELPKEAMSISTFNIIFFAIGGVLVPSLEKLRSILKNKETLSEELESSCL